MRPALASWLVVWALASETWAQRVAPCPLPPRALSIAPAQQPASGAPAAPARAVRPFVAHWTRAGYWHFFDPPAGGGDPTYGEFALRLQAGLRWTRARWDAVLAGQYVQFLGLPTRAVGPGPLGTGAVYFEHSGRRNSGQAYLRYLTVRMRDLGPGITIQVGRQGYTSGAEAASGDRTIEAVKRQRVDARLLGEFEWSLYQRSFDGVRIDWARAGWQLTGAAVRPTQGGFEDAAGLPLKDVGLLVGTLTLRPGRPLRRTGWDLFALRYTDHRAVTTRPDNTGRRASQVELDLTTLGTTLVGAYPLRRGTTDVLGWVAVQTGRWYELTHRAQAVAVEGGYQWGGAPGRPWWRAGVLYASGDRDPTDGRHGTFFPVLPTARKYALSATYSPMNLVDLFTQLLLAPGGRVTVRVDLHRLRLATAADRWYTGSGATQARGTIFGYAGRPSQGAIALGTVIEGTADCRLTRHWSLNGYAGVVVGGEVVRRTFAGHRLVFAYLEQVLQF